MIALTLLAGFLLIVAVTVPKEVWLVLFLFALFWQGTALLGIAHYFGLPPL